MSQHTGTIPVADLHLWAAEATQGLLGFTIGLDETAWHQATALPGWSRAHVATHLARNADYLRMLIETVSGGDAQPAGPTADQRLRELERGADRSGLELQIDLDTSAGALQQAIDKTTDWSAPIRLHGQSGTLGMVPLSRLHEVCVHHLDLDRSFDADAIDADAAAWLLRWVVDLVAGTDLPALRLTGDSLVADLGAGTPRLNVSGSDARLWAWLCGRTPAASVSGADGLQPPLLA